MEPTDAEKEKARRVQLVLYVLIAVMIGVPVILMLTRALRFQ